MEISEIYGEEVILIMIQINLTVAKTRHRPRLDTFGMFHEFFDYVSLR